MVVQLIVNTTARERVVQRQAVCHVPRHCESVAIAIDAVEPVELRVGVLVKRVALSIVPGDRGSNGVREWNIGPN